MPNCTAPNCERPTDLHLCTTCQHKLATDLKSLAGHEPGHRPTIGFLEALHDATTGQTRMGTGNRATHNDDEAPIPFNERASNLHRQVAAYLDGWCAQVKRHLNITQQLRALPIDHPQPLQPWEVRAGTSNPLALRALWLSRHVRVVASRETAGGHTAAVTEITNRIARLINRPVPQRFLGPCTRDHPDHPGQRCGAAVTADRDATTARCWQCGANHDPAQLIADLFNGIEHWLLTAGELFLALDAAGEPVPRTTFYRWRRAGRIQPAEHRADGTALYRIADVRAARDGNTAA